MLITVSGPPGSGTTTTARNVAARLELTLLPGGEVFREMAVERGMSLAEFGLYAIEHPEVDIELDSRLGARARDGAVVIESRLAGWIVKREHLTAVTAWVDCAPAIRADRVASREGTTPEQAHADNVERESVERERYLALYGIDLADLSIYDVVVDSGTQAPADVAAHIVDAALVRFA